MSQNAILSEHGGPADVDVEDVAASIAQRTLAPREAAYADEVRRLLDAALEVMRRGGTGSRARVVDIVAAAGLSNEAFYRHFRSKDALVSALLADGALRLRSYLAHQMAKEPEPVLQVRRWVEGVLAQADGAIAESTLAVLHHAGGGGAGEASGRHFASGPLATLLVEPFTALGSDDPQLAATFVAHAVLGSLSDHLWGRSTPTTDEIDRTVELCLTVARSGTKGRT